MRMRSLTKSDVGYSFKNVTSKIHPHKNFALPENCSGLHTV